MIPLRCVGCCPLENYTRIRRHIEQLKEKRMSPRKTMRQHESLALSLAAKASGAQKRLRPDARPGKVPWQKTPDTQKKLNFYFHF